MKATPRKIDPSDMTAVYRDSDNPKYNPGRRKEIKYRDLGLEEATKGEIRAEMMEIKTGTSQPTGWHYHTCDVQFLHMIKGWVKMEFPGSGPLTLRAGESITIPGGMVHQELCSADNMELLEITIPAKMGTVNVEAPEGAKEKAEDYGDEISEPIAAGHAADT